jgi:hypothetical protein
MQAGLASIKRNCNAKENFKQVRTHCGPPEQKSNIVRASDHDGNQPNPQTDFDSIISNIGHLNSKTFTMPNNAHFAQKWQSFQNTLQQLTLDWIDILQECTKTDGVCVEPTTKETEKSHQDTQKCKKMLLKKKSQTHKADAVHYESNQEPEHDDHI